VTDYARWRELAEEAKHALDELKTRLPGDTSGGATGASAGPAGKKKRRPGMSVAEVNDKAREIAKRMGEDFFKLSQNRQAELIGTTWKTWSKTKLFRDVVRQGRIPARKQKRGGSKPAVTFTHSMEAVLGVGGNDAVLKQLAENEEDQNREKEIAHLVAEQDADQEPSPLDPSPKRVKHSKRL
jgi:hypothetical protein